LLFFKIRKNTEKILALIPPPLKNLWKKNIFDLFVILNFPTGIFKKLCQISKYTPLKFANLSFSGILMP